MSLIFNFKFAKIKTKNATLIYNNFSFLIKFIITLYNSLFLFENFCNHLFDVAYMIKFNLVVFEYLIKID